VFARQPAIADVSISPDGKQLLYITAVNDETVAVTLDRQSGKKVAVLRQGGQRDYHISWCAWANETRVLCGLQGIGRGAVAYKTTRLVGVNADGSNLKVLVLKPLRDPEFFGAVPGAAQFQDRIIDFTPAMPDTVLLQVSSDDSVYPAVAEMDVYTGQAIVREQAYPPILVFTTDGDGKVRLGYGLHSGHTTFSYFARFDGEAPWRHLVTLDAVARMEEFEPLQVTRANKLYATGPSGNQEGVWELDLERKADPRLLFSHPSEEAAQPIYAKSKRLIGVAFGADKPVAYYFDRRTSSVVSGAGRILPDSYVEVVDTTPDQRVYVLHARSDADDGSYHVLDVSEGSGDLQFLGTAYPELDPKTLGRMQSIQYEARDGTDIPGYLTLPPGQAKGLPVVVMPHDGPDERDSLRFDYLRHFLVSRGYAVLQMNFRGSEGYGADWERAAHGDWGGPPYLDITDGARWAAAQAFADPGRVCILGRGFGGYAALLSAARESGLYRCAVSIAGPTDLEELRNDARYWMGSEIIKKELGKQRLEESSPAHNAARVSIPVLLIHGTDDTAVDVKHSRMMASALKRAGKDHELLIIDNAQHDFRLPSERTRLLEAVEKFLATQLKGSTPPVDGG
jgi:dipeptidyl aminopeptidase/acylaminoacyl peptidase